MIRPDFIKYFMNITKLVSTRSTCIRRSVGAVIIKDKRILATGYNGAPTNIQHCIDIGCLREQLNVPSGENHELCRGIHAEQNAIIQSALHGIPIKDSILFCTTLPCSICAKMIINACIKEVIYYQDYNNKLSKELFKESGIKLTRVKG